MLTGERVLLRAWTAADAPAVHRLCQDPEIQRWTSVPVPYTPADAESLVLAEPDPATALFAVVDRAGGAVAGSMSVVRFHQGVAMAGYWTGAEFRGAGRTAEALRLLTAWCFAERDCVRVELTADVRNTGSCRVAVAAGFRLEGVLRQRMLHRGERIDTAMYARLRSDP